MEHKYRLTRRHHHRCNHRYNNKRCPDTEISHKKGRVFALLFYCFSLSRFLARVRTRGPEGVVVFLLKLLQVGGVEVKLRAGRKADGVLGLGGRRTVAGPGRQAERRQVCRATGTGERHRKYRESVRELYLNDCIFKYIFATTDKHKNVTTFICAGGCRLQRSTLLSSAVKQICSRFPFKSEAGMNENFL